MSDPFVGIPVANTSNYVVVDVDVGAHLIDNKLSVAHYSTSRPSIRLPVKGGKKGEKRQISVARWIMNAGADEQVLHLNGNRLDCRRVNLEKIHKHDFSLQQGRIDDDRKRRREYPEVFGEPETPDMKEYSHADVPTGQDPKPA